MKPLRVKWVRIEKGVTAYVHAYIGVVRIATAFCGSKDGWWFLNFAGTSPSQMISCNNEKKVKSVVMNSLRGGNV